MLAKIKSVYLPAIRRCYKTYLLKDPSARGLVRLKFTVTESGSTFNGTAHGFASEVDACITAHMPGWRFPIPRDRNGDATNAIFTISIQLVTDS